MLNLFSNMFHEEDGATSGNSVLEEEIVSSDTSSESEDNTGGSSGSVFMPPMEPKDKVYIQVDEGNRVTRIEGGFTCPSDLTGWICVDEGIGDTYHLAQSHYMYDKFGDQLYNTFGIPNFKYENEKIVKRSAEEIQDDIDNIPPPPPTENERLRADIDYLSAMTGVDL